MGNTLTDPVQIANVPLSTDAEAAYAAYSVPDTTDDDDTSSSPSQELLRAIVINMHTYNTTVDGTGLGISPNITTRVARVYTFDVSSEASLNPGDPVGVRRLSANGSDAITGITWDGWSYNWELDEGRPVRLDNVTVGEYVTVSENGTVAVSVPDASIAMLDFSSMGGGSGSGSNATSPNATNATGGGGGAGASTSAPANLAARRMESGASRVVVAAGAVGWALLSWMI